MNNYRTRPLLQVAGLTLSIYFAISMSKTVAAGGVLPDGDKAFALNNATSIQLTANESNLNKSWAFLWQWLYSPEIEPFRETLLNDPAFKDLTYTDPDGKERKLKRPLLLGNSPEKTDKNDHFISPQLMKNSIYGEIFDKAAQLFCKKYPSDSYCHTKSNRGKIYEERTLEYLKQPLLGKVLQGSSQDPELKKKQYQETKILIRHSNLLSTQLSHVHERQQECMNDMSSFSRNAETIRHLKNAIFEIQGTLNHLDLSKSPPLHQMRERALNRMAIILALSPSLDMGNPLPRKATPGKESDSNGPPKNIPPPPVSPLIPKDIKETRFEEALTHLNANRLAKALPLFREAGVSDLEAYRILGQWYSIERAGKPSNGAEAKKWYLKAAEKGDLSSELILAQLYENEKNYKQARIWYEKAATSKGPNHPGDRGAQAALGDLYQQGKGGLANPKKAAYWHNQANAETLFQAEDSDFDD